MAKCSPLLKSLFAVLVILFASISFMQAQSVEYLNSNNIIAGVATGGNLFSDSVPVSPRTATLFHTKFDSGRAEIYTSALWMNALDEGGNLHGAAQTLFEFGIDYYDGPISALYDAAYDNYYHRVFKISQTQIDQFRNLSFPVSATLVDSAIRYWPGKGNTLVLNDYGVSIDSPLAPFVDLNNNGLYEPLLGDYPRVVGDQNIFFVFNDIRGPHNESACSPLGFEIRGMASSFIDTARNNLTYNKRAINNSVFIQYEVENKSQHTYSGIDLGFWADPDIGCFDNDYVGSDSARSLMFAYNGVQFDPTCYLGEGVNELGFDSMPVSLGIQILSQPMSVFGYFMSCGSNCPAQGDPVVGITCAEYRNFLNGFWADGSPFEYGKSGYNSGGYPTKFCFSGDPTDSSQWSEVQSKTTASDRRMFCGSDFISLIPGQTVHFDLGFITSFDSTSNNVSIVDTLKRDADSARAFYLHRILPTQQTLAIMEVTPGNQLSISIYPNPASDQVTIVAGDIIKSVELMDIQGRVLLTQTVGAKMSRLPVSNLARGVYLVNIQCDGGTAVRRIVVE